KLVSAQGFCPLKISELRLEQFVQRDMRAALVPLNSGGALLLAGYETFDRHKQIRTQASFLATDCVQISVFEQTREKLLDHILRLLPREALATDKSGERSPISTAKHIECFLCSWRFVLRLQHDAPMSGGECHCTTTGALDRG